ncbi:c-type cytochrome [Rhodobacteraceae bacterium MCCB 386]|nr:c-type cytochrome [Roseitranquillus sediminis]
MFAPCLLLLLLPACDGPQSALAPAGREAELLADLFWIMLAGAVVLWLAINGLMFYVTRINVGHMPRRLAEGIIIGGGIVFPVIVLAALLGYGLTLMPLTRVPGDGLRIRVTGEQWWWRVEYWPEGAEAPVVAANEVRLPSGRRTDIELAAHEVIHSFWIPALGGKTDMFPGRDTLMTLEPLTPGVYRGQCAEFCGESHALMAFQAVVLPEEEFADWLEAEAAPARPPSGPLEAAGQEVFLAQGCGACHTVRGTPATGAVGPDLTHVGSRLTIGAGTLPPTAEALANWIAHPGTIKPGVEMPSYDELAPDDLAALAAWLEGLE